MTAAPVELVSPYDVVQWADTFPWRSEHRVRLVVAGVALGADGRRHGAQGIIEPRLLVGQRRGDPVPVLMDHNADFTVGRVAAVELARDGSLVIGAELLLAPSDALAVLRGKTYWSVAVHTGSRPDDAVGAPRAVEARLLHVAVVGSPSARAARPLAWSAAPLAQWERARPGAVPPGHAATSYGPSWTGSAGDADQLRGMFRRARERLSACRADVRAATDVEHYRDEVPADWHEHECWRLVHDRRTPATSPARPSSAPVAWRGLPAVTVDSRGPHLAGRPSVRIAAAAGWVTRVS